MPAAPISLYIDLEPDRVAELEVVARASIEFAAAIREIAFMFDPSLEIRIELESGQEGSLRLNALIRWVRGLYHANPTLFGLVAAAASWFALETGAYTYEKFLDYLLTSPEAQELHLTNEQMEDLARRLDRLAQSRAGEQHVRGVFRELSRDPAVRGVGIAPSHEATPAVIIPRADFAQRSGQPVVQVEDGATRTSQQRGSFIIIKPVLKDGGGRWRLKGPQGEFSASIRDQQFLDDIMHGKAPVPLAAEIHIDADVEMEERFTGEVWKPIGYKVVRVYSIERQPDQAPLFPPPDDSESGKP